MSIHIFSEEGSHLKMSPVDGVPTGLSKGSACNKIMDQQSGSPMIAMFYFIIQNDLRDSILQDQVFCRKSIAR